ncbi:Ig-like domain-containing protein, partial [Harryflintia acetispora]|uniref:Ig-like domain-containing protein n=1 Tax=Harryflintia acetispora TaxID=1849041 RepID=UPI001896A915
TNSNPGAAAMTVAADGRSATIDASGRTAGSTTITAHIKGAPDTAQYKASCTVTVVTIGSVSVSPGNYTIYTLAEPRTVQLTATVTPNAATVWSSSNPAAATVNQTGLVTAVAPGSTTVTATVGGRSGSSTITVKDKIPVASVTVSGTNSLVRTSDKTTVTSQLSATVKPDNAHFKAVSWAKTGGSASININASGLVTATAAGSATFTATADGVTSTPYTVTVTDQKVTGITVAQKSVDKGGTVQMSATVSPSNAVNKNVTWSLASGNVATVNASGLVTGGVGSNGTVTVKATAADGSGKSGSATVTVNGCAHALSAGGYGSGAGTSGSPWLVTSQAQLSHIFSHEGSSSSRIYFRQDRNIQFSLSSLWPPVPLNYANYNGDGYLLTGCNNSIFSSVNNSTLQKVGIPGGSVTVEYPYAGSLFVYSENTTIDQCFSACNVYSATGDTYGNILFGGLGGTLTNSTLSNCYYTGNISWGNTTGDSVFAGGLLSDTLQPGATVKNCYSRGGFTGPNPGKIWTGAIAPRYQPSSPPSLTNVYWGPSAPCALRVWSSYGVNNLNTVYVNANASYPGLDFTNVWRMQNGWPVLRAFDH